eukprot:1140060-Pelagomonas_calceolata.AAC.2
MKAPTGSPKCLTAHRLQRRFKKCSQGLCPRYLIGGPQGIRCPSRRKKTPFLLVASTTVRRLLLGRMSIYWEGSAANDLLTCTMWKKHVQMVTNGNLPVFPFWRHIIPIAIKSRFFGIVESYKIKVLEGREALLKKGSKHLRIPSTPSQFRLQSPNLQKFSMSEDGSRKGLKRDTAMMNTRPTSHMASPTDSSHPS